MQTVLINLDSTDIATLISEAVHNALATSEQPKPQPTQEPQGKEQLLSQTEVAKFLNCSKQTIINWAKKGFLPERRIGRRVLYNKVDVLNALRARN